jgi:hypothetical protein
VGVVRSVRSGSVGVGWAKMVEERVRRRVTMVEKRVIVAMVLRKCLTEWQRAVDEAMGWDLQRVRKQIFYSHFRALRSNLKAHSLPLRARCSNSKGI